MHLTPESVFAALGALSTLCAIVAPLLPDGRAKAVLRALGTDLGGIVSALRGDK